MPSAITSLFHFLFFLFFSLFSLLFCSAACTAVGFFMSGSVQIQAQAQARVRAAQREVVLCVVVGNSETAKLARIGAQFFVLGSCHLVVYGLDLAHCSLSKSDSDSLVTTEKVNCDAFYFFPALLPTSIIAAAAATLNESVNFPVTPSNHCSPTPTPLHFAPVPPTSHRHPVSPLDSHEFRDTSTAASANDAGDDHGIGRFVVVGVLLAKHRRGYEGHKLD